MISTFGWIVICFFLLIIKYAILDPISDNRLYRLYEARDNVALAAIEGEISQEAEEYKFVIKNINFALHYMKNNYDFSIVLKNMLLHPERVQKYFSRMFELVKKYDFLVKNYQITTSYFRKSLNFRLFIYMNLIIRPICFILLISVLLLKWTMKLSDITARFIHAAERRITIITEINSDYNAYKKNFAK